MNVFDQIEEYRRRILWAHYDAFGCIQHAATKGAMRERAVSRLIKEAFPTLFLTSGVACAENSDWESPQLDIIELKTNAQQGIDGVYRISDATSVCEVKTKARANDFKMAEESAKLVKDHCEARIATRVFAFATEASAEYVISQFGFAWDKDLQSFESYAVENDKFPSVDCFISLDASAEVPNPFLIVRDMLTPRVLIRSNERVVDRFLALYKPE